MRRKIIVGGLLAFVLLAFGGHSLWADVTLSDPDPQTTNGNWTAVVDPSYPLAGLYVINSGNSYSRYDAAGYLILGFNHSEGANIYWGAGEKFITTYTPSSDGAITSLDYSLMARKGSYDGVRAALLLIQDGKYYRSDFYTLTQGSATPLTPIGDTTMIATDFGEFVGKAYDYGTPADGSADFGSNPDFSATGSTIEFGWLGHYDSTLNDPSPSPAAYLMTDAWSVTIHQASIHQGDANGDGMVNLSDLQILGDNWQASGASWSQGDFTGDGNVNLADLQILGDNWGYGAGPDLAFAQAVDHAGIVIPEPATLVLAGFGVLGLLRRRAHH
ncbi:MAG: PEP-CTERM sorting domain-containing protein [Phycisphaeraceae bacterium]|nr:PEP-CTERM sorting domain-containing protein [Phycisphaeraceae bacterium]